MRTLVVETKLILRLVPDEKTGSKVRSQMILNFRPMKSGVASVTSDHMVEPPRPGA